MKKIKKNKIENKRDFLKQNKVKIKKINLKNSYNK